MKLSELIALSIFTIVLPLVISVGAANHAYKAYIFTQSSIKTTGTVTEIVTHSGGAKKRSRGKTYSPIIEFTTQTGQRINFESDHRSYPSMYEVGESVDVIYNPQAPNDARIYSYWSLYFFPTIALPLCGLFLTFGIFILRNK